MASSSKWSKGFWSDLVERVGATFLGALLTTLTVAETTPVNWTDAQVVWTILGIPTVFSLIKGLLANLRDPESGASLINHPPGPEVQPGADEYGRTDVLYVLLVVLVVVAILVLLL